MLGGGLSPLATMLALRSASLVQGLSDPTNTITSGHRISPRSM